ncbi:hypothetical protein [Mycobacterium sp. URHB0021]
MRLLRGLLGALLWVLGAVLGLVGLVLCVTVILLPLGIPVVAFAGRIFAYAVKMMLPRSIAHPIDEFTKTTKTKSRKIRSASADAVADTTKKARKVVRKQRKLVA